MEALKTWWKKLRSKLNFSLLKKNLSRKEGGKSRLNGDIFFKILSVFLTPLLVLYLFTGSDDTSYVGHSPSSLASDRSSDKLKFGGGTPMNVPFAKSGSIVTGGGAESKQTSSRASIKLSAKQVIIREADSLGYGFNAGSNLVGELQSTIDTRDPNQVVRVLLPFGGRSRDGSSELPKGTLLMGKVTYPGKGEKVFIAFDQAIFPEGRPIKIAAQALDPKDYSSGLIGEIQSQAKARALSVMGLSVVSAMGDVLTEKEALGQGYSVTPKATMKNAIMTGVGKAAEVESGRLQEQTQAQDFVRVDAGTVVIVSLTAGLTF